MSATPVDSTAEVIDEEKDAQHLSKDLREKRKKKKKELRGLDSASEEEDVGAMVTSAKKRQRKKFEESVKREIAETGGESTEDTLEKPEPARRRKKKKTPDEDVEEIETLGDEEEKTEKPKRIPRKLKKKVTDEDGERKTPRTPRSGMSSLREKMRSRIQQARDKGEDEGLEETRTTRSKLRSMKDSIRRTRFDDPSAATQEEIEEERQLQSSRSFRAKWKESAKKVTKSFMPTRDEQYDFFCLDWEKEKTEEEKAAAVIAEESETQAEVEQQEADRDDDELSPFIQHMKEAEELDVYEIRPAEYVGHSERVKNEDKLYYYAPMMPPPLEDKLSPEQREPRYMEDEGLYVGRRPYVEPKNQNRLEHRLLKDPDQGRKWFGEDGQITAQPDPLKEVPTRPYLPTDTHPFFEVTYGKAEVVEYDNRYIDGGIDSTGQYEIDLDLNSLTFSQHHLFSREHVFASRLQQLFKQYCVRAEKNLTQYFADRLKALKGALTHAETSFKNAKLQEGRNELLNEQEKRLKMLRGEVRDLRAKRNREEATDRTLIRNIIRTFKQVKNQREIQRCTNTPVKLTVRKVERDKAEEEGVWTEDINDEVEEEQAEIEGDYNRKYAEYKIQLDEWKKKHKALLEAKKRRRQRKREGGDENEEDVQDEELMSAGEAPKPDEPEKPDLSAIRERIEKEARETRRRPGEPMLYPEVTNTATITPTNQCPRDEQHRRAAVSRTNISIKIMYNNKEVRKTKSKPLTQDFSVTFGEIFALQIIEWPESIRIQIREGIHGAIGDEQLASLYIPIPEKSVTSKTMQLDGLEFSSPTNRHYSHAAVGSGELFDFGHQREGQALVSLVTTGVVNVGAGWGLDEDNTPLVPPTPAGASALDGIKGIDPVADIGGQGVSDLDRLTKWVDRSNLDPNDPANADLMYLIQTAGSDSSLQMPDYFRLEQLQEEFDWCGDEELAENKRFRLLQLRNQEVTEFRDMNLVPAFVNELAKDAFDEYEKRISEEQKLRQEEDIESHRKQVARFLQRVREAVLQRFRRAASQRTYRDVIDEDPVPNIAVIIPKLVKLAEPPRPLRPVRKERKRMAHQNITEVKILVNINRAINIPVRTDTKGAVSHPKTVRGQAREVRVRPFVEVSFQRNSTRTLCADGSNPCWNEELELPFKAPNNNYSKEYLQTVADIVYINVFDEIVTDDLQDERERGTTIQQRIEKRWLGSLKIPFTTIYFNQRIQGTFKLDTPIVQLGYKYDRFDSRDDEMAEGSSRAESTYLDLYVTMEPLIELPDSVTEKFDTMEDTVLLSKAESFMESLMSKFPERDVKTAVIDINGKIVFITRYFQKIKPPDEILNKYTDPSRTAELVSHFVSLIPFVSDSVIFPGLCDIWSTSDQFLNMMSGDEDEHAVLLCNYFLYMDKQAWLVIGTAVPEGATAYVLTYDQGEGYRLWNASTGEHWKTTDYLCPVQRVDCVVNGDNIWANVQSAAQPSRISFDVTKSSNWKPFFSGSFNNPGLPSIQPEKLTYLPTEERFVRDLQEKILKRLREKIMEWRPRFVTRWNRHCEGIFRNILPKLEEKKGRGEDQTDHSSELSAIIDNYKLSGFPIQMPYTEMQLIFDMVHSTRVHVYNSSDIEFALAVYVHPYPNSVLSVWVYVASLRRR